MFCIIKCGSASKSLNLGDNEIFSNLIQNHLCLNSVLENVVNNFCSTNFEDETIGIHIRNTNESGMRMFPCERYFSEIDKILQQNRNKRLFVSTDNRAVLDVFRERYSDVVVYEKWFNSPGEPLHQRCSCPDGIRNLQDAVVEMFILARADYLVIPGNSGFSNFSQLITNAPESNIVSLCQVGQKSLTKRIYSEVKRTISSRSLNN